jgi:ribonuclease P protein component
MERLKRRRDFRALAQSGARAPTSAFVLQARRREHKAGEAGQEGPVQGPVRVGFTVSKQVGTAVERNRIRRRLREIVRLASKLAAMAALAPGHDYVLIGRRAALDLPFAQMLRELDGALRRVHGTPRHKRSAAHGDAVAGAPGEPPLHKARSQTGDRPAGESNRNKSPRGRHNRRIKPRQNTSQGTPDEH